MCNRTNKFWTDIVGLLLQSLFGTQVHLSWLITEITATSIYIYLDVILQRLQPQYSAGLCCLELRFRKAFALLSIPLKSFSGCLFMSAGNAMLSLSLSHSVSLSLDLFQWTIFSELVILPPYIRGKFLYAYVPDYSAIIESSTLSKKHKT